MVIPTVKDKKKVKVHSKRESRNAVRSKAKSDGSRNDNGSETATIREIANRSKWQASGKNVCTARA